MSVPMSDERLAKAQRIAFGVGAFGLVVCGVGWFMEPDQFYRSYLLGYLFWVSLALGSLGVLLMHNLVGGNWGLAIRKLMESASFTLPLMGLLMIPLFFGLPVLYEWARPQAAYDPVLQHKAIYLNVPFFLLRVLVYFAMWSGMAWWNRRLEKDGVFPFRNRQLQAFSGPGTILFCFTVTFAMVDWMMSIEAHWYSTVYGAIFLAGQALTAIAAGIYALRLLSEAHPEPDFVLPQIYQDLGNLLLAFTMLWAYLSFSQLLIIYSGDLPEETPWYVRRMNNGYAVVALIIIAGQFVLPFLILLSRFVKRRVEWLSKVAILIIAVRLLDLYWQIEPGLAPGFHLSWLDFVTPIAIGGVWIGAFLRFLRGGPISLPRIVQHAEVHS